MQPHDKIILMHAHIQQSLLKAGGEREFVPRNIIPTKTLKFSLHTEEPYLFGTKSNFFDPILEILSYMLKSIYLAYEHNHCFFEPALSYIFIDKVWTLSVGLIEKEEWESYCKSKDKI